MVTVIERSASGRCVSRLSLLATDLLTRRLAKARPDALVTDEWQPRAADYRILVGVSGLDITQAGTGVMAADWQIVPRDTSREVIRGRTRFTLSGPVASERDMVDLERALFERLADEIDISKLG